MRGDVFGDGVFHGGGDEDVAIAGEAFFVGDGVAVREIVQVTALAVIKAGGGDVDAGFVEDAARFLGDGDDIRTLLVQQPGGMEADVAKSLDGDARAFERFVLSCEKLRGA